MTTLLHEKLIQDFEIQPKLGKPPGDKFGHSPLGSFTIHVLQSAYENVNKKECFCITGKL
jgi:hypothetical protein